MPRPTPSPDGGSRAVEGPAGGLEGGATAPPIEDEDVAGMGTCDDSAEEKPEPDDFSGS